MFSLSLPEDMLACLCLRHWCPPRTNAAGRLVPIPAITVYARPVVGRMGIW